MYIEMLMPTAKKNKSESAGTEDGNVKDWS
jgi:hypothetical protein